MCIPLGLELCCVLHAQEMKYFADSRKKWTLKDKKRDYSNFLSEILLEL